MKQAIVPSNWNKIKFKNSLDDRLQFGKYRNLYTIKEMIEKDPDYIQWLFDNIQSFDLSVEAKEEWRLRMLGKEDE